MSHTVYPAGCRGFTLVELLATVSIALILTTAVIPASAELFNRTRSQLTTAKLVDAIQYARQLAIAEQRRQTLCISDDGSSCDKTASRQLLVFSDSNNNKRAEQQELRYQFALQDEDEARLQLRVSGGRHYLRFRPDGTAIDFGSLQYCPGNAQARYARQIIINYGGRLRFAQDADEDGIAEDRNGDPLQCL